ncbi:Transposase DDE domain protein [Phycisphaerae bacterium RAS1]|nr:Transposase DDE domain protein [Phycisphaerae bacterium RAS1]
MLILTDEQLDWIAAQIPDPPARPKGGRPIADKRRTLRGIFWILDNGAKWKDLPSQFGSKSTVHRWFARWVAEGVFERLLQLAGRLVETRGGYRLYECYIDGTFAKAKSGGDGVGLTKVGKGVKIMVLVDARGLPVAVETMSAGPHESKLVQRLFDFMLTRETPPRVIGDKAYDCDELDAELAERGIELIAPHRSNRSPDNVTQDRRPLQRYRRRWTVERSIAWIQNFRRLCIRWEKSTKLFQGFLHLGCTLLLLRPVLG